MGYYQYLRNLLEPLGVYTLEEGSASGAALGALGGELDAACGYIAESLRESVVLTAENSGLTARESLFARRPAAESAQARREAIGALLLVSDDGFTLSALRRCLSGCGVTAGLEETDEAGVVEVSFPTVRGTPQGFERMSGIIEDILPCHLLCRYVFRYLTWAELETLLPAWSALESACASWSGLETYSPES